MEGRSASETAAGRVGGGAGVMVPPLASPSSGLMPNMDGRSSGIISNLDRRSSGVMPSMDRQSIGVMPNMDRRSSVDSNNSDGSQSGQGPKRVRSWGRALGGALHGKLEWRCLVFGIG